MVTKRRRRNKLEGAAMTAVIHNTRPAICKWNRPCTTVRNVQILRLSFRIIFCKFCKLVFQVIFGTICKLFIFRHIFCKMYFQNSDHFFVVPGHFFAKFANVAHDQFFLQYIFVQYYFLFNIFKIRRGSDAEWQMS